MGEVTPIDCVRKRVTSRKSASKLTTWISIQIGLGSNTATTSPTEPQSSQNVWQLGPSHLIPCGQRIQFQLVTPLLAASVVLNAWALSLRLRFLVCSAMVPLHAPK